MPVIINDRKIGNWVDALTNGCECGGRTVARTDYQETTVIVTHCPFPGSAPYPDIVISLTDLQDRPDATLDRYGAWVRAAHDWED
jgi:hypothetical protein